jgi:F0F1-type ATP synthase membrane subunit b/b'
MSSLNLIPDVELLCAQTGIFLANLVVVKTLFITPYLELQKKRKAQTADRQNEAKKTLESCAQQTQELESRIKAAYSQAGAESEDLKSKALAEQKDLIAAAKKQAEVALDSMRQEIAALVQKESNKIPALAAQLSKEFYQTLTR